MSRMIEAQAGSSVQASPSSSAWTGCSASFPHVPDCHVQGANREGDDSAAPVPVGVALERGVDLPRLTGSRPTSTPARPSSIRVFTAFADSGDCEMHSPQPTTPSSVSIRAKVMWRSLPPSCGSG